MLNGATAKCMCFMSIVFSLQRNANFCVKELFFVPGFLKGEWSDVAWISTCLLPSEEHWP